jgi:hypothetical protein
LDVFATIFYPEMVAYRCVLASTHAYEDQALIDAVSVSEDLEHISGRAMAGARARW